MFDTMARKTKHDDEMRRHYDFSGGVRGKYAARYAEGIDVVVLAHEVADVSIASVVRQTFQTRVPWVFGKSTALKATRKKRR